MKKKLCVLGLSLICLVSLFIAGCAKKVNLVNFEDVTINVDYGSQYELITTVTDEDGQVYTVTAQVTDKETNEAVIPVNNKIDILSVEGYTIVYSANTGSDSQTCTITLNVIDSTIPDVRFGQAAAYGELNTPYTLPAYEVKDSVSTEVSESVRLYRTEGESETVIDPSEYANGTFVPTVGGNYTYEVTATDQSGNTRVGEFNFYVRLVAPGADEVESFNDACALDSVNATALDVQPYSNEPIDGVTNYLALKYSDVGGYASFTIRGRHTADYYLSRGYGYLSYKIYIDPDTVTEDTKKFETLDRRLLEVAPGTWQEVFVDFDLIAAEMTDEDGAESLRLFRNTLNDNADGRVHDGDMVFYIADVKFRKNEVSGKQLVNPLGDVADKYISSNGVACVTEDVAGVTGSFSINVQTGNAFAVAPVNAAVLEGHNRVSFQVYAAGTGSVSVALASGNVVTVPGGEWTTYMVTASSYLSDVEADGYGNLFTIRSVSGEVTDFYVSNIVAYQEDAPSLELGMQDSLGIVNKEFVLPTVNATDADGNPLPDDHIEITLKNADTEAVFTPADGKFTPNAAGNYEFTVAVTNKEKSVTQTFKFYVSEAAGLHADTNGEAFVTTDGGSATYVKNFAGKAALKLDMSIGQWPPVRVMPQRPMSDYEGYDTFVITFRVDSASFGEPGRTSRVVEVAGKAYRIPLDQWISFSRPIEYFYEDGNAVSKQFFAFWEDRSWPGCEQDTFSVYIAGMEAVKSGETLTDNNLLDFSNIGVMDNFRESAANQWSTSPHALYLSDIGGRQNVVGLFVTAADLAWKFNLPESVNDYAFIEIDVYLTTKLEDQYLVGLENYALKQSVKVNANEWTTIRIPVSDYLSAETEIGEDGVTPYKKMFLTTYGSSLGDTYRNDVNWLVCIGGVRGVMREEPELELIPNDSLGIVNKEFVLPTFEGVDISGDPITSENATVVLKNTDTDTTVSDIVDGIFTPTEAGNYEYSVTATDGDKSVTKTFVFYVSEAEGLHADANGAEFVTTDGGSATYVENFAGKAALKLDMPIGQWPPVRVMPQRPMSDYEGYDTFVITFRVDSASFGEPGRTSRVVEVAGKAYRIPLDQWISFSRPISYFYENGNAVSKQFFAFWCDGESSDAHKNWPGCEPDTFSVYIAGMEAVKSGETLTENNLLDFSNIAVLDHFKDSAVDKWASSTHALYLPEVGGRQNVVGLYVSGTGMGWSFNLPESVNDYAFIEIDVYLTTTLADQYLVGHSNYALKETQKITSGEWTTIRISVSDYNSAQTAEGIDKTPYKKMFLTTFEISEEPYKSDVNWLVCIGGVRGVNEAEVTE